MVSVPISLETIDLHHKDSDPRDANSFKKEIELGTHEMNLGTLSVEKSMSEGICNGRHGQRRLKPEQGGPFGPNGASK